MAETVLLREDETELVLEGVDELTDDCMQEVMPDWI